MTEVRLLIESLNLFSARSYEFYFDQQFRYYPPFLEPYHRDINSDIYNVNQVISWM